MAARNLKGYYKNKVQTLKDKARHMKNNLGVLYLAFKHDRTPWYAKVLIGLVVSYALSPVDLIPDFVPVLGYLDDLILIPAGIALAIKLLPDDVLRECREDLNNMPLKISGLYAAIAIIIIWLLLILLIIRLVRN